MTVACSDRLTRQSVTTLCVLKTTDVDVLTHFIGTPVHLPTHAKVRSGFHTTHVYNVCSIITDLRRVAAESKAA